MSKLLDAVRRRVARRSSDASRPDPRRFRVGEHNLHDQAGAPRFFADVVLFTEAVPATIRAKAARLRAVTGARLRGYRVLACKGQRDLVIAVRRSLFVVESVEYRRAHAGRAGVTPHRGTYVVKGRLRGTRIRVAILVEHRINSWWKDERGEQEFRALCWHGHTDLTLRWIHELEADGYVVIAGGDLNTPPNVRGYDGALQEVSASLDRLAISRHVVEPLVHILRAHLDDFDRGPAAGSDHHEISARATVRPTVWKAAA